MIAPDRSRPSPQRLDDALTRALAVFRVGLPAKTAPRSNRVSLGEVLLP